MNDLPELEGFSEDEIRQLMELGLIPEEMGDLNSRIAQARADARGDAMPGMRDSGRVQTAAHPLEFLAAGLRAYKGNQLLEQGTDTEKPLNMQLDNLRQRMIDSRAMAANRVQGLGSMGAAPAPAPGMAPNPVINGRQRPGMMPSGAAPAPMPQPKNLPAAGTVTPGIAPVGPAQSPQSAALEWARRLLEGSNKSGGVM